VLVGPLGGSTTPPAPPVSPPLVPPVTGRGATGPDGPLPLQPHTRAVTAKTNIADCRI
jgi:hypothetical protein